MAANKGKIFEHDFQKSSNLIPGTWTYRPSDFGGGQAARFTNHSLCDYIVFNDNTQELFLIELKSVLGKSISCPSYQFIQNTIALKNTIDSTTDAAQKKKLQQQYKDLIKKGNTYQIKLHQIQDLYKHETAGLRHMFVYFIINFREYEKTFALSPSCLLNILRSTQKSSININEFENFGAIPLSQTQIRKSQHYIYDLGIIIGGEL